MEVPYKVGRLEESWKVGKTGWEGSVAGKFRMEGWKGRKRKWMYGREFVGADRNGIALKTG